MKKILNYLLRNIPPDVWKAAKHQAVEEGITLRELIFKALREYLKTRQHTKTDGHDANS